MLLPLPIAIALAPLSALGSDRSEAVAAFDTWIAASLERFAIAGAAVGVVDDGDVVLAQGYGKADWGAGTPITRRTRFNIGSVSKLVSAWGFMTLADEGLLDVDAALLDTLEGWELPPSRYDAAGVTARRLLSHTAGLSLHGYPGFAVDEPLPSLVASLSGATGGAGDVQLISDPGSTLRYSGGGYSLLQLWCEEHAQRRLPELMAERVFGPLGMETAGYNPDPARAADTALPHDVLRNPIGERVFVAEAAAGVYASLDDMLAFALAHFDLGPDAPIGRGVLRPETVVSMREPVDDSNGRFGMGFMLLRSDGPDVSGEEAISGHAGDNPGYHALIAMRAASRDALIVLTNGDAGAMWRNLVQRPWTELVGIDPPMGPQAAPAALAVLGTWIEHGAGDAIAEYERLEREEARTHSFSFDPLQRVTQALAEAGHLDSALEFAALSITKFPDVPRAWYALARVQHELGDLEAARGALDEALGLAPHDPKLRELAEALDER